MERFEKRFNLNKPIVVADAGLLSADNIAALNAKQYGFILGARIKNESNKVKLKVQKLDLSAGQVEKIVKDDDTTLFVCYSPSRARKDAFNREKGLKRLEKGLKAGRLTKSSINNRGYNKYLKLEGEIKIEIDYQKFENDSMWDGLKGYITNTNPTGEEVIDTYNNLWLIERAFRISKTDLKIRPIYHRSRERIEAHICISFVSYLIFKEFERALSENEIKTSVNQAIKQINKMHEVIFQYPNGNQQRVLLKNNPVQEQIMQIIERKF